MSIMVYVVKTIKLLNLFREPCFTMIFDNTIETKIARRLEHGVCVDKTVDRLLIRYGIYCIYKPINNNWRWPSANGRRKNPNNVYIGLITSTHFLCHRTISRGNERNRIWK